MDSVTQACLGAAIGGVVMPKLGRRALLLGAALGTLPDLDVLIDYGDAVANFTHHRGFSHSLFVLTGIATLFAGLASCWHRTRTIATFGHWWWLFALCLLTHPILDAFTTYGTQLLWPLPVRPISWNNLAIIDPAYTLPLLIGVIVFAFRPSRHRLLSAMLALSCIYIVFSFAAQAYVSSRVHAVLVNRGLEDAPVLIQPAPLTTLLWRVTVIDDARALDGWVSLFDGRTPISFTARTLGTHLRDAAMATPDGRRLAWFCGPFLRYHTASSQTGQELHATDIRLLFPGAHPFVFAIAQRQPDSAWQPMPSYSVAHDSVDFATVKRLVARIVAPEIHPTASR
ncbi:metal-dependent hydrolase [Salinisphaera sp. SPP-AMP-43]|uniref:metal-dependent hydrolase n=1 Tax=Salinisphaera sp. SPP-AMP-43 TaxID=3121288 RepID=UPI003C6DD896